ncbi:hypothetical protein CK203_093469 [Vitis vinifera]|uniref:DUF4283 domain-containing protein n=2 Tax=Vitis vinifera TaxID=29760 RepID=A0A438BNM4_VITVI|nr:hypothetical protein CK203_093469 [Vitis vinifera]
MSRIDHFLITGNWEEHFTNTMLILLPRPMFDHSPILLEEGGVRRGMTPFRFESMWLKAEGFKDMVKGGGKVEGRMVMWNPCFLRYFQDWEMDNVAEFLRKLYTLGRSRGEEGRMVWKASKSGEFLMKSFYSALELEGLVNGLEWELCEQEEKKGLENNSSLPLMDNLEARQPKNLLRGAVHKPIS